MTRTTALLAITSLLVCFKMSTGAQEARWGSPDEPTVKAIIANEAKWANSSCSPQPDLKEFIADDFQGTTTKGNRYTKPETITTDINALAGNCELGDVKVRFFGDSIAIAYGSESRIPKSKDGKDTKRCQVWTDTWLKRNGQWQIIAAQDTIISCN
jgi:Domain of unknown function (DUF4440)